ncbi:hypothetical protein D3C77_778140 [compost metagenome]
MGLADQSGSGAEAAVLDYATEGLHGAELVHQGAMLLEVCGPLQALVEPAPATLRLASNQQHPTLHVVRIRELVE